LRVFWVFSRLNIGGLFFYVILLSAGLRFFGYDTRFIVGRESPREGNMLLLAAEKNVVCESMVGLGCEIALLSDLRALARLHCLMRVWRPAIVHTHTARRGLGRIAARAAGVPPSCTQPTATCCGYFSPAKRPSSAGSDAPSAAATRW
jgi:hypothetical protein